MQDRSEILYEDTNAPTAALSHLMIIATIAARERRQVKTLDIGGAYLNADISSHEIFMELDRTMAGILCQIEPSFQIEFLREDDTMIVKLLKALYGCVESAKLWYNLLTATLISHGFIINPLDLCIFNKNIDGKQLTIVIYVDDLFITCVDDSAIDDLVQGCRPVQTGSTGSPFQTTPTRPRQLFRPRPQTVKNVSRPVWTGLDQSRPSSFNIKFN